LRALLLAAGLGMRLRPLTDSVPKCLVDIDGRPLLDYWIELLSGAGVVEILVNLHHLRGAVEAYLRQCPWPVRITTVYEDKLLGTAGTLLKNRAFFRGEPVMLVHADNLSKFDARAFVDRFERREKGVEITMMTFRTSDPRSCGIVELDDRGIVTAFHEKVENPPGNLANGAVYILSPQVTDFLSTLGKEVIDFSTEVLPRYLGRINTFHNAVYHRDIGTLRSLAAARAEYPVANFP
jgi:mannose-1-phosphate guanylyltransferase